MNLANVHQAMNLADIREILLSDSAAKQVDAQVVSSFICILDFLRLNPDRVSGRGHTDLSTMTGIKKLYGRYRTAYLKPVFPSEPRTTPDELVSLILQQAYGYTETRCEQIKLDHQRSMGAENCVGALLEKYICYKSASDGWAWCCGELVKATDFIKKTHSSWLQIQIKNRDNSENSSSSAIRNGTDIQKWFRTYSKTGKTNWENLPNCFKDYGMSETDFHQFCIHHLTGQG
ncbi:MAG: hypothetical protein RLZZ352_701 [Pseudomonadota bacterium]